MARPQPIGKRDISLASPACRGQSRRQRIVDHVIAWSTIHYPRHAPVAAWFALVCASRAGTSIPVRRVIQGPSGGTRAGRGPQPGTPAGAAPAGRPRPPRRARRGPHPVFSIFPLRPPLTRGASAQLTTCTLTQADAAQPAQARHGGADGRNRPASRHLRPRRRSGAALFAPAGHPRHGSGLRRAARAPGAPRVGCGAFRRGRPSWKQRRAPPGQRGQPGALRPGGTRPRLWSAVPSAGLRVAAGLA